MKITRWRFGTHTTSKQLYSGEIEHTATHGTDGAGGVSVTIRYDATENTPAENITVRLSQAEVIRIAAQLLTPPKPGFWVKKVAHKPLTVRGLIGQLLQLDLNMPVAYHAWDNAGPYTFDANGGNGHIFYVDPGAFNGSGALVTIPDDDSPMPAYIPLAEYDANP